MTYLETHEQTQDTPPPIPQRKKGEGGTGVGSVDEHEEVWGWRWKQRGNAEGHLEKERQSLLVFQCLYRCQGSLHRQVGVACSRS